MEANNQATDKAEELIKKFIPHAMMWDCYHDTPLHDKNDVQCALICVEEILILLWDMGGNGIKTSSSPYNYEFWVDVKNELLKM